MCTVSAQEKIENVMYTIGNFEKDVTDLQDF